MIKEYKENKIKNLVFMSLFIIILIVIFLFSLYVGSYDISFTEMIHSLFGLSTDEKINNIIFNMRLSRVITAILSGLGLGICGCVLQSVLKNPLASSSTLGISQGAAFGATFAVILLGVYSFQVNYYVISLSAFVFSMFASIIILFLSSFKAMAAESVVLAGVALGAMFQGAATVLQFFADETQLSTVVFWLFGDLGRTTWYEINIMFFVVLTSCIYFFIKRFDYNVLLTGEDTALSIGVEVRTLRITSIVLSSFVASVVVSQIGIVNFIGLIAPHIARLFVGDNHTYLLPLSAVIGAVLLLLGDLLARLIIAPIILPIGAITSFCGAPLFIYLLLKGGRKR